MRPGALEVRRLRDQDVRPGLGDNVRHLSHNVWVLLGLERLRPIQDSDVVDPEQRRRLTQLIGLLVGIFVQGFVDDVGVLLFRYATVNLDIRFRTFILAGKFNGSIPVTSGLIVGIIF